MVVVVFAYPELRLIGIDIRGTLLSTRLNLRNAEYLQGYISLWISANPVEFIPVLGTAFSRTQDMTLVNIGMVKSIGPNFIHEERLRKVIVDGEYKEPFTKLVCLFGFALLLKKSANVLRLPKRVKQEKRIAAYKIPYLRNVLAF